MKKRKEWWERRGEETKENYTTNEILLHAFRVWMITYLHIYRKPSNSFQKQSHSVPLNAEASKCLEYLAVLLHSWLLQLDHAPGLWGSSQKEPAIKVTGSMKINMFVFNGRFLSNQIPDNEVQIGDKDVKYKFFSHLLSFFQAFRKIS